MIIRNILINRFFVLLALAGFLVSGCSPARKAMKTPIKEEGADFLFGKLKEHELKYEWFSAKFSADYSNKGKNTSLSGQIRIRKDSLVWITLSPMLGIEAVRLIITQDSVKMINRLSDSYFIGTYDYVNKFLDTNIDFDLLQAFLLGNDLQYYEQGKFNAVVDRNAYKLSTAERQKLKKYVKNSEEQMKIFIQNIWLDPESFKIIHADVKEIKKDNIKLESTYSGFQSVDGQLFPSKMSYVIRAANLIKVKAEFSRITVNEPQSFPFKVPADFRSIN